MNNAVIGNDKPQVAQEIDKMEEVLSEIENLTRRLRDRLESALRPSSIENGSCLSSHGAFRSSHLRLGVCI